MFKIITNILTMYYRRKIILALLDTWGGKLSNIFFQKLLFLFCQKQSKPAYHFIPYKYGCFSFQSYADRRALIFYKLLMDDKFWNKISPRNYFSELTDEDKNILIELKNEFVSYNDNELLTHIYKKYPYFAINSIVKNELLTERDILIVNNYKPNEENYTFFTIGYEGKDIDEYLNILISKNIKILCDVRKNPLSKKYGFSKSQLKKSLEKINIRYEHFPELGIDSEKRKNLKHEWDYIHLFNDYEKNTLPKKQNTLQRLYQLFLENKRVAITCFETNSKYCHRHKIADYFLFQPSWNYSIVNL